MGQSATGQGSQSAVAAALVELRGTGSSAESQSAVLAGVVDIPGAATTSQVGFVVASGLPAALGFIEVGTSGQSVAAAGLVAIDGLAAASAASQAVGGAGIVELLAVGATGQSQTLDLEGVANEVVSSVVIGQSQGANAVGEISISGDGVSAQTPYVWSLGEEEILASGASAQSALGVIGTGFEEIAGAGGSGQVPRPLHAGGFVEISGSIVSAHMASSDTSGAGEVIIAARVRTAQEQDSVVYSLNEDYPRSVAIHRLLNYPHAAVFDKSPEAVLALRIGLSGGLEWKVERGILFLSAPGFQPRGYQLSSYTIASLAGRLAADGIEIVEANPAVASLSALSLVAGSGAENASDGNRLTCFASLLWVFLSAYGAEIDQAYAELQNALRQMVLTQAEDEWLDLWGMLYGVPRWEGELDPDYRDRIEQEAFRLRVNGLAIEQAIADLTGSDVTIVEPWKLMFRLDESALSGPHRLQNADYYNYHIIQAVGPAGTDWPRVRAIVDRNRAAGVIQYQHRSVVPGHVLELNTWDEASLLSSRTSKCGAMDIWEDRPLLDYSRIEDVPVLNHASRHRQTIKRTSVSKLTDRDWLNSPWPEDGWGAIVAFIHAEHSRTYRVHYSLSFYEGMPWPRQSWSGRWTDSTSVESGHSRLS